jgi:hypothetical protein
VAVTDCEFMGLDVFAIRFDLLGGLGVLAVRIAVA